MFTHTGFSLDMVEYKGYNSNAQTWVRLKHPKLLRSYLKIAEIMNIPMPLKPEENYEYDPKQSVVPWPVPMFFRPYNHEDNIELARSIIAKELSDRGLLLEDIIDQTLLMPLHHRDAAERFSLIRQDHESVVKTGLDGIRIDDNWYARSLEEKRKNRTISQCDPLPTRGILKNRLQYTWGESRTDNVDIEDPEFKYKPGWRNSAYAVDAEMRHGMRSPTKPRQESLTWLDQECNSDEKWFDLL